MTNEAEVLLPSRGMWNGPRSVCEHGFTLPEGSTQGKLLHALLLQRCHPPPNGRRTVELTLDLYFPFEKFFPVRLSPE